MATRTIQIFILEFSKGGSVDLGDEFADGGVAVALQGGVGLFSGHMSQGQGQFESNFSGFMKLVTNFLMWW